MPRFIFRNSYCYERLRKKASNTPQNHHILGDAKFPSSSPWSQRFFFATVGRARDRNESISTIRHQHTLPSSHMNVSCVFALAGLNYRSPTYFTCFI